MEKNTITDRRTPKIVFIVPYRNRANNLNVFRVMMAHVLEDYDPGSYEVFFAHQDDTRPFNRGGIKNVGFMAVRDRYPNAYKDITFVFNDVDTVPSVKGLINYETTRGVIKHFYGVRFALGGIFSITGHDFEIINGFPCYWSWGYEDNVLNNRAMNNGLTIDRNTFFNIGDSAILQTVDSYVKSINRRHKEAMRNDDGSDGVSSIRDTRYEFDDSPSTMLGKFINVSCFEPIHKIEHEHISNYNLMSKKYVRCLDFPSLSNNVQNQAIEVKQEHSQERKSEQKHELHRKPSTKPHHKKLLPNGRSRGLVMVGR